MVNITFAALIDLSCMHIALTMGNNRLLKKFKEWEYWPSYMYYVPNLPYAVYLTLKARNFTFYSAVNPGIKNSGNGTESKFETLSLIPDDYKPKSVFVGINRNFDTVTNQLKQHDINYPIIAKPDVGFRGLFVKKLHNDEDLKAYLNNHPINLIIQEFISLPRECGVFYQKHPDEKEGTISSLTFKLFMQVTGDGTSTIEQLVMRDQRAKHYIERLQDINRDIWHDVLDNDKSVVLSEIGNHARGTEFVNGNEFIDAELTNTFNELSRKIPGFYYGRFDIKYNTFEELKQGRNFKFLEVNGIISEPTHIYDANKGTYFGALKTIRQHWKSIYDIALTNKKNGTEYMPFKPFWLEVKDLLKYYKNVKQLAKSQNIT